MALPGVTPSQPQLALRPGPTAPAPAVPAPPAYAPASTRPQRIDVYDTSAPARPAAAAPVAGPAGLAFATVQLGRFIDTYA